MLVRNFSGKYESVAIAWYCDSKASGNFRFNLAHSVFYEFNPKWVQENLNQLIPLMKVTLSDSIPDNRGRAQAWAIIYRDTGRAFSLELNMNDKVAYDDAKRYMATAVMESNPMDKPPLTETEAGKRIEDFIIPLK